MTSKAIAALMLCLLIAALISAGLAMYYRGNAIDYKAQRDKSSNALKLANETIDDMAVRQRDVAALDAKYTGQIADAKATIYQLQRDVAFGKRRLQLNAKCSTSISTGTTSMDDAASARLNDSAERDYFTLRERIEVAGKQIAGLQQYINEQCRR